LRYPSLADCVNERQILRAMAQINADSEEMPMALPQSWKLMKVGRFHAVFTAPRRIICKNLQMIHVGTRRASL